MKREETDALHGPWLDESRDHAAQLAQLQRDFGSTWTIWRGVRENGELGDWCARRTSESDGARIQQVTVHTAAKLRELLEKQP